MTGASGPDPFDGQASERRAFVERTSGRGASPGSDVLTSVLRSLRLRGTTYFDAGFQAPWGMEIRSGRFANFHLLTEGGCWLRRADGSVHRVEKGDLVVFPHGERHALLSAPESTVLPAERVIGAPRQSDPLVLGGEGEPTARMICGHFELDGHVPHPIRESLPEFIHLRATCTPDPDWIQAATRLAAAEARADRAGSGIIVDRLAEALMVRVIRALSATGQPKGFLAALSDPVTCAVLRLVHDDPARAWTVESLAAAAHVSRSMLARRFRSATGSSPIQYLRLWRMINAREILAEGGTVRAAAHGVGYGSEWSFAKAFKRTYGVGPGQVRAEARGRI